MKTLVTDEQRAQLLANGRARAEGQPLDPLPIVKLFTPDAHATWLLTELDPEDGDTAYGLCDLGLGMPELGTVRLSELVSIRGPLKLPISSAICISSRSARCRNTRGSRISTARSSTESNRVARHTTGHLSAAKRGAFYLFQSGLRPSAHQCVFMH